MTYNEESETSCPAFVRFPVGEVVDDRANSGAYWDGNMGFERLERNHTSNIVGNLPKAAAQTFLISHQQNWWPTHVSDVNLGIPPPHQTDLEWRYYVPRGVPAIPAVVGNLLANPVVPAVPAVPSTTLPELVPYPFGGDRLGQTMGINIYFFSLIIN
jgi:hypothetical protein